MAENLQEFIIAFQITKNIIFEVAYYTLGGNSSAYFTTEACKLSQNKRGYSQAGQAQKSLLVDHLAARGFFEKWDKYHLHKMDTDTYDKMFADVEFLMSKYNWISRYLKEEDKPYNPHFNMHELVELSKMPLLE